MGDFFNSSQFEVNQNAQPQGGESSDQPNTHAHVSLSHVANLTRKEDGLIIHRQKIQSITVIGMVVHVEELTTKNLYIIDDYTGGNTIEVQFWKNDAEANNSVAFPPPIMERTYVRVVGQARYDEKKPFIVAFIVEPITNPNDIATHFLEVIADNLILEKRKNATLNNSKVDGNSSYVDSDFTNQNNRKGGFNEVHRSVLNVLDKYSLDSALGLTRFEIKNYLPGVSADLINEALSFLENEGHIFNTVNSDTFKSTGD